MEVYGMMNTPSTNRLLPLVNLTNLQITSRGRVVFNVMPAGQMNSDNDVTPFSDTSFLSPEYLNNIGKKTSFSESDIEKMWIYSLGITLYKAIPSTSGITPTNRTISGSLTRINNDRENDDVAVQAPVPSTAIRTDMTMYHHSHSNELDKMLTSLDCVISAMCAPKLHNRASLMYLLDVISEYCRCHHQIKPFSHIVMDLFQEALEKVDINASISVHLSKMAVNRKTTAVDNRSDTDSGNSSAQGDRDIYTLYNKEMERNNKKVADKRTLKVSRTATDEQRPSDAPFNKFNPIGFSAQSEMEEKPLEPTKRLQVTRRRDEILKRRNRSRRNTIAVNLLDVNKCSKELQSNVSWDGSCSKSTNCIDKIAEMEENGFAQKIDELQLNGCSMPGKTFRLLCMPQLTHMSTQFILNDCALKTENLFTELNGMKFSTLPNLKVRRTKETANSNQSINQLAIIKSIGPEFIANSSLSPLAIDITDAKEAVISSSLFKISYKMLKNDDFLKKRKQKFLTTYQANTLSICKIQFDQKKLEKNTTTAQEIFETVIKCENFVENFFLGICALIGGDFVFLPPDLKIHKVAPEIWFNAAKKGCYTENVIFTLFLRTKFFLPTLRGIGSLESRHLLYLQLRKSILESHILCNDEELISLGGLALQSEIGDFTESMKHTDYFTISHYLPEGVYQRNKGMAKYLRSSHFSKKGLQSRESEYNFIRYVQEMKEYGLHLFSAVWSTDDGLTYDVYVAVSLSGIRVFKRSSTRHDQSMENSKWSKTDYQRTLYANFEWLEIENLCFSKHILCVVIRKSESLKAKDNNRVKYKFRMDGRKSYFAFHLASEHHRFYMKLRNSFISLKALSDELNYPLNGGMNRDHTVPIPQQTDHSGPIIDHFLHKIEQPHPIESSNKSDKPADGRVGKLKKSMLNDNRLLKLRNKFLKRSKSSVSKERICLNPNGHSMEENQNKENECPKIELPKQSQNLLLSPNRNRVKMGTRVFSAQFLNKSFDNVSDSNGFNMYRFDSNDGLDAADAYPGKTCTFERDLSDDGMSLTSTSLSSLYYSEKMSEKFSPSPLPTEAYVIQASMKSNCDINQFSMFNETISDSLFEKFNNLSKNNTIGDRIINRITIVKDSFAKIHSSKAVVKGHRKYSLDSDGGSSIEDNSLANKFTLGISIIQGSDNNVYVKDLVKNGPGERGGIEIGDQILAVNGTSLLNLSYDQSLQILQNTGTTVELTVSQIYKKSAAPSSKQIPNVPTKISTVRNITRSMKNSFKFKKDRKTVDRTGDTETNAHRTNNLNENDQNNGNPSYGDAANWNCKNGNDKTAFKVRSMPDLPKVVGTIPKHQTNDKGTLPRTMGLSRKYVGPVRYPVTPIRPSNGTEKQRLSLLADNVDKQVFI
ncbi:hypothetical protein HA402_001215 [Bradysia odoriphaga]|nr:hypothetical protein HA402_001215 [Bradysia odoriphaga]